MPEGVGAVGERPPLVRVGFGQQTAQAAQGKDAAMEDATPPERWRIFYPTRRGQTRLNETVSVPNPRPHARAFGAGLCGLPRPP